MFWTKMCSPEKRKRQYYYYYSNYCHNFDVPKILVILSLVLLGGGHLNGVNCSYKNYNNVRSSINLLAVPSSSSSSLSSTVSPPLLTLDKYLPPSLTSSTIEKYLPPSSPTSQSLESEQQQFSDPINHSLETDINHNHNQHNYQPQQEKIAEKSIEADFNFWRIEKKKPFLHHHQPHHSPQQSTDLNANNYHNNNNNDGNGVPTVQRREYLPPMNQNSDLISNNNNNNNNQNGLSTIKDKVDDNLYQGDPLPAAERVFVRHSTRKRIRLPVYTTVYSSTKIIPDRPVNLPLRSRLPSASSVRHQHNRYRGIGGGGGGRRRRRRRPKRRPSALAAAMKKGRRPRKRGGRRSPKHQHHHHYQTQASSQLPGYAPAFVSYGPIYGPPPGIQIKPHGGTGTPTGLYGVQSSSYIPVIHPNPLLSPPVGPPHPSMQVTPTNYHQPQSPRDYSSSFRASPPALTISVEAPSNNIDYPSNLNYQPHRPMSTYGPPTYNHPHPHQQTMNAYGPSHPVPTYGPPRPTHLYPVPSNSPAIYAPHMYSPHNGYGSPSSRPPKQMPPPMNFGHPMHNFGPPMSSMGQPPPLMDDDDLDPWSPATGYHSQTYPHMYRGNYSPQNLYGAPSSSSNGAGFSSSNPNSLEYNHNNYPHQDDNYNNKSPKTNNYYYSNSGAYRSSSSSSKPNYRNKYKNNDSDDPYHHNNDDDYSKGYKDYNYNSNDNNYGHAGGNDKGSQYGEGKYRNNNNYDSSYGGTTGSNSGKNNWSGKDNSIFHFDDDFEQNFVRSDQAPKADKYKSSDDYYKKRTPGRNSSGSKSPNAYPSAAALSSDRYRHDDNDDKSYNYNFGKTKMKVIPSHGEAFEDVDGDKYGGGSNNYNNRNKLNRNNKYKTSGTVTIRNTGNGRPPPSFDTDYNSPGMSKDPRKTDYFGWTGRSKGQRIKMGYPAHEKTKPSRYTTLPVSMDFHRPDKSHNKLPKLTYDTLIKRILPDHEGPQFLSEENKIDTFKAGSEFTKMISDHDNMRL